MDILTQDARELFDRYLTCWNNRDFEGVADYFETPSMYVLPTGAVSVPDRTAVTELLKKVFIGLDAEGFSHSDYETLTARRCSQEIAVLDVTSVRRHRHDGSVLEEIDAHYVIRKGDTGGWRLVVAVVCDAGWHGSAGHSGSA